MPRNKSEKELGLDEYGATAIRLIREADQSSREAVMSYFRIRIPQGPGGYPVGDWVRDWDSIPAALREALRATAFEGKERLYGLLRA